MADVEYHWLVTLQWTDEQGTLKAQTGHGTITLGTGATRENLTDDVLVHSRKQCGAPASAVVLCFELQPNAVKPPKVRPEAVPPSLARAQPRRSGR